MLNGRGRLVFANSAGETLLQHGTVLRTERTGGLHAVLHEEDQKLRQVIHDALHIGTGSGGGVLTLHRADGTSVSILVAPLPTGGFGGFDVLETAAIVFVSDPTRSREINPAALAGLFTLTTDEAKLLQHLADGMSLKECADAFALSHATVRTQLASILHKTGCQRQTEVVRLALLSPLFMVCGK